MSERHQATEINSPPVLSDDPAAAEQRGSFLGFVAHEMRNPLSTALWSAELLARLSAEDRAGPRSDKLIGMCLRSLQRLRLLVEDHFLADRLAVGGMPLRIEAVPLRDLVEAVNAKASQHDLAVEVPADLSAWADRGLIERALDGLLAVAGRGGAAVRIRGVQEGAVAVLRFHGASPAPDALQPPRKGTASDPSGRALALHMVVHVTQALGGSLSTTGDEFVLSLPCAPSAAGTEAT